MKRHLAIFVDTLYGAGVQRSMLRLARDFAARGHRVDFLVCTASGHFVGEIPDGVELVPLPPKIHGLSLLRALGDGSAPAPGLWWPALRFVRARHVAALVAYLRERRPYAVLAAATTPNLLAVAGRRLAGTDTRVVISQRTTLSAKVSRRSKRWKLPLVRSLYPEADAIIAISHGVADDLAATASIPRGRIDVVYNPIFGRELLDAAGAAVPHPWLRGDGPPVVVAVGRLKPRKDYATLIRAFALLRERAAARLLILGEGEEHARLVRLVAKLGLSECVELPGFTDNPFAWLSRASLFAHSAKWEGFGNVLVEALACGCPVVSTDCPSGPSEILDGGKYGKLSPVGDPEALAEAMYETLETPPDAHVLRRRAQTFSVDAIAEEYLAVLDPERATGAYSPKR